ncbi:MAG: gamma-glutamyltransferase [Planctomyces sp.]
MLVPQQLLLKTLIFCCLIGPVSWSLQAAPQQDKDRRFTGGVVAADHPAASAAGARILREGGNVVDAAVATSFALSVVRPASCGIGGGGFMVIWDAEKKKAHALDYRERAPAQATADRYGDSADAGHAEPVSVRGGLASGIPGTVHGLCYALDTWGRLSLRQVLQPAIELCESGVLIDAHDREVQAGTLAKLRQHPDYRQRYSQLLKLYLNDGQPWRDGDRFYSPLGPVLKRIAELGRAGFYDGPVAAAIAAAVADTGGVLTAYDLEGYQPTLRQALQAEFRGAMICTMPPPSSGGIALLQTLQSLECWERRSGRSLQSLQHNSADYVHVVTEAFKHAFADRAEFLGDADFVDVPVQRLLSPQYAEERAAAIRLDRTLPLEAYGRFFLKDDAGTSHFSVLDAEGNGVACTETINLTFGSFVVVPEWGILLNNEMDDFSANPGKPNAFGLLQSAANSVQPGKRPLSSMTPTLLVRDGRAVRAVGASGGPRIISATVQNLLNQELWGMSPSAAVSAARFHHQWAPNELLLEAELKKRVGEELEQRGHQVRQSGGLAATQGAARDADGTLQGGSDPRKNGQPAGFDLEK